MCAAPGGKATALAAKGATVVAADLRPQRVGLIADNAQRLGYGSNQLSVVAADGSSPPFAPGQFDAVLLDAPAPGWGRSDGDLTRVGGCNPLTSRCWVHCSNR